MTVDITQVLKESIETLRAVDTAKTEEDISKQLDAIDNVLEYIDQIDIANGMFRISFVFFSLLIVFVSFRFSETGWN